MAISPGGDLLIADEVCYSLPEGRAVAVLSVDGTPSIRSHPEASENGWRTFSVPDLGGQPRFSSDGRRILLWHVDGESASELAWDTARLHAPAQVLRKLALPDQEMRRQARGNEKPTSSVRWDTTSGGPVIEEAATVPWSSPAITAQDGVVILFSTENRVAYQLSPLPTIHPIKFSVRVMTCTLSNDGRRLAVWHNGSDRHNSNRISIYDVADWSEVQTWLTDFPTGASTLTWLCDDQTIVATHAGAKMSLRCRVGNKKLETSAGWPIISLVGTITGYMGQRSMGLSWPDRPAVQLNWDFPDHRTWGIKSPIKSADGRYIAASLCAGGIMLIDSDRGAVLHPPEVSATQVAGPGMPDLLPKPLQPAARTRDADGF